MDNNEIDYKRAAKQLRNGEPLFGKDGALASMLERILNAALEGEMISKHFEREFGTRLSAETISSITDRVLPEIKSWRSRMLDPVYVYVVKQKCTTANVVIYSDISLFYYQKFFC